MDLESGDELDFEYGYLTPPRPSSPVQKLRPKLFHKYSDANVLSLLYGCLFFALLVTTVILYSTLSKENMELPARHITLGARHIGRMEKSRELVGRHFLATPMSEGISVRHHF